MQLGGLHILDDTPAWNSPAPWPCKLWWQQISRIETIFLFIAVWDGVWMKYGLSLDQKKLHGSYQIVYQQSQHTLHYAECVGIAIFSLGAGITLWWVLLTLCLGWWSHKPDQTNHSRLCAVSCIEKGQVASQWVCGMYSEEKLIASFWRRTQV